MLDYSLIMNHAMRIRSHYIYLINEINIEFMLLEYLWADDVISSMEKEDIKSRGSSFRQKHQLLSLSAMNPADVFERFLKALDLNDHGHVTKRLFEERFEEHYSNTMNGNTAFLIIIITL